MTRARPAPRDAGGRKGEGAASWSVVAASLPAFGYWAARRDIFNQRFLMDDSLHYLHSGVGHGDNITTSLEWVKDCYFPHHGAAARLGFQAVAWWPLRRRTSPRPDSPSGSSASHLPYKTTLTAFLHFFSPQTI